VLDRSLLSQVAIFGGLADGDIELVSALLEERRCDAGAAVCREGEPGHELFVIVEGRAEVTKRARDGVAVRLSELGPGACFGETSLIGITVRTATVSALTPLDLLSLPYAAVARLSAEQQPIFTMLVMNLAREVCRHLQHANERLIEAGLEGERR